MTTFPTNGTVDNRLENPRTTLPVSFFAPKVWLKTYIWFLVHLNFGFQPLVFYMSPATTEFQDHSGFASLEELDPLAADHLAKQPWRKEQTQRKQQNWGISGNFLPNQQGPTSLMMSFFQEVLFSSFFTWEKWSSLTNISWKACVKREVEKTCRQHGWVWLHEDASLFGGGDVLVGLKVMLYFQHLFCNDVWGTFIPNPDENKMIGWNPPLTITF